MTDPTVALLDYLRKMTVELDPDFLRECVRLMSQLLIELEVSQQIGAQPYERSAERATQRNGYLSAYPPASARAGRHRQAETGRGRRGWARRSFGSRSCARGRIIPACWSRGDGPSRRC